MEMNKCLALMSVVNTFTQGIERSVSDFTHSSYDQKSPMRFFRHHLLPGLPWTRLVVLSPKLCHELIVLGEGHNDGMNNEH